jgi:bifunctional DNA-binding transcriptional regulator/antitoxin component of YhaV-PrlF toxin-antitoxin module
MSSPVSTITSKWQVTIPEGVRKNLPFAIGQRIVWEVEGDKLVGRRVRSVRELAGSLKSTAVSSRIKEAPSEVGGAALARHDRIARQKP